MFALSGGAYAATQLPKNSVGHAQLKANAVTGAKVRDGSLTSKDFRAGEPDWKPGLTGPQGPPGPPGEQGASGPMGPSRSEGAYVRSGQAVPPGGSSYVTVVSKFISMPQGSRALTIIGAVSLFNPHDTLDNQARCFLRVNGIPAGGDGSTTIAPRRSATIPLTVWHTVGPLPLEVREATVSMHCAAQREAEVSGGSLILMATG